MTGKAMSGFLAVRNWRKFQHYKDRRPIWIKVHTELVTPGSPWLSLSIEARGVLTGLWLLAAEYGNVIPNDPEHIAKLLRTSPRACRQALTELKKDRWIQERSTARRASRSASPEKEKEKEKETPLPPLDSEALEHLNKLKLTLLKEVV